MIIIILLSKNQLYLHQLKYIILCSSLLRKCIWDWRLLYYKNSATTGFSHILKFSSTFYAIKTTVQIELAFCRGKYLLGIVSYQYTIHFCWNVNEIYNNRRQCIDKIRRKSCYYTWYAKQIFFVTTTLFIYCLFHI